MQRRSFSLPATPGSLAGLHFGDPRRGPEALFLHANGFCASTYRGVLEPVGRAHPVLAVDQRGHGRTSLPADPLGRADWLDLRDDLLALLEVLDGPPLVLAGHSMGATVSALAAAASPARVKALVLFDPVLLPEELVAQLRGQPRGRDDPWPDFPLVQGALKRRASFESRAAALGSLLGRGAFKTWPDPAVADYLEDGLTDGPDGTARLACAPTWEASNYCAQGHDGWAALKGVRCPTRILRAEVASTCDPSGAEATARANPLVTVEQVPGATHFIPQERPELASAALVAALQGGPRGTHPLH